MTWSRPPCARPIRLRAACVPPARLVADARSAALALAELAREAPDFATECPAPSSPPTKSRLISPFQRKRYKLVAAKKVVKTPAAAVPGALPAAPAAVVKEASAALMGRLQAQVGPAAALPPGVTGAVPGRQAALFGGKFSGKAGEGVLKKLVAELVPVLGKVAAAAGDGNVSPGELVEIGMYLFGRFGMGQADVPSAAGPPPPRVA